MKGKISLIDLYDNNWVKGDFYPASSGYIFKKGAVYIVASPKSLDGQLVVRPCFQVWIDKFKNIEELENFYNKYK